MNYLNQLKTPQWQKKRLQILERDQFKCRNCNDEQSQLQVHHIKYIKGRMAWEYPDKLLITLCELCHGVQNSIDFTKLPKETWKILFMNDIWTFIICTIKMIVRKITKRNVKF